MEYKFFTIDGEFLGGKNYIPKPCFFGIVVRPHFWKAWYKDGLLHREDGPAVEYVEGGTAYYLKGENIRASSEEFKLLVDLMKLKDLL